MVCARTIPVFKAELVKLVKRSGKVVLAIGDGANDVNMLTVAHGSDLRLQISESVCMEKKVVKLSEQATLLLLTSGTYGS